MTLDKRDRDVVDCWVSRTVARLSSEGMPFTAQSYLERLAEGHQHVLEAHNDAVHAVYAARAYEGRFLKSS